MNKIVVAGIGPGSLDYITPAAMKAVEECNVLVAGKRNLEQFRHLGKETFEFGSDMEALISFINGVSADRRICVAVSGDPGFYSLLDYLLKKLGKDRLEVIPGISSFQYLFCKLAKPWKDYCLISMHGKESYIGEAFHGKKGAFFLTDKKNNPTYLAKQLIEFGYGDYGMIIGENLSYEDEKITAGKPADMMNSTFSALCVVVVEKNELDV